MMHTVFLQTLRNIKMFLKEKSNVFFSLLTPLIALGLYALFLGKLQSDALSDALKGMNLFTPENQKVTRSFLDCWMLSGVLASACITVPLGACGVSVMDKTRGIYNDLLASPIPKWLPSASYFLAVVASSLVLSLAVFAVCCIWALAAGAWFLSAADFFSILGTLVLSVLSSSMIFVLVSSFLKSQGAFAGVNTVVGTLIGFVIGAYMPVSMLGKAVGYIALAVPGFYSASLFRSFFVRGALEQVESEIAPQFAQSLSEQYAANGIDIGNIQLNLGGTAAILAASVVLFALLNLFVSYLRKHKRK